MQSVLLVMKRRAVAQGVMLKLHGDPELNLTYEPDYARADTSVCAGGAQVALIEVAESGEPGIADCLRLCGRIRRSTPRCKLLLMCPEQDKASVGRAVRAKREGEIDDFIFYDASIDYLASKLSSL